MCVRIGSVIFFLCDSTLMNFETYSIIFPFGMQNIHTTLVYKHLFASQPILDLVENKIRICLTRCKNATTSIYLSDLFTNIIPLLEKQWPISKWMLSENLDTSCKNSTQSFKTTQLTTQRLFRIVITLLIYFQL